MERREQPCACAHSAIDANRGMPKRLPPRRVGLRIVRQEVCPCVTLPRSPTELGSAGEPFTRCLGCGFRRNQACMRCTSARRRLWLSCMEAFMPRRHGRDVSTTTLLCAVCCAPGRQQGVQPLDTGGSLAGSRCCASWCSVGRQVGCPELALGQACMSVTANERTLS
jgi:hypothetical protein